LIFLFGPNKLLTDASSRGWVEQMVLETLGNSQAIIAVVVFVAGVFAARSRRGETMTPIPPVTTTPTADAQLQKADATK
ncbi:MAG TPA: glycosyltransferase, partial [Rhodococcus sp. (in: high G+C Gram-positive bacteria)]|nr:glycosyltransferase [Rhodococcus sp. (in: high G+C Gram-positive bacteria)]